MPKPDIGRESQFLPTHLTSMPLLGGFPPEYCHNVWYGKTRMMWLPDGEKIEDMFNRFDRIHESGRQKLNSDSFMRTTAQMKI